MKNLLFLISVLLFFACEMPTEQTKNQIKKVSKSTSSSFKPIKVNYPTVRQDSTIVEDYHGMNIADPYRWLEDDNSNETKDWVVNQNKATFGYLDQIPFRKTFQKRLKELWNYERFSTPFKEGGKYYFYKNDGLQNQSILYVQDNLDSKPTIALDPNKFSADGTSALGGISFNKKGNLMAYQVSEGGSDWHSVQIKDMETGKLLSDKLEWLKFTGISWVKDGFYYSRYPTPEGDGKLSAKNEFHQVYFHKIGTPQSEDKLIFDDKRNPSHGFFANTTDDERFLTIQVWESTSGNALYFKDLSKPNSEFVPVVETFDADFNVLDNMGDKLLVLTNHKAPNQRLVLIDVNKPQEGYWENLIPEQEDVLRNVDIMGERIVATYIHNASSMVKVMDMKGKLIDELKLPGIGTLGGFSGKKVETNAFYSFESFTRPNTIYSLDMLTLESSVFKAPTINFNPDDFITKQLWYNSKDGTRIPMFVTHKKGLKLDGQRPTLLYGYGGFDISILPGFNTTRLAMCPIMIENDGIFVVANIRGGGEFGKKWHQAGTLGQKQNVFNDFIAAAEHLIAEDYTSSDKLAIYGRSNGGLLIGACMTQRPDLFKVALPAVGVLDMLRYQNFTIGRAWASDYGLSETSEGFDYLKSYSPLHNVTEQAYPATMVTTADHDDRVVPAHSFKFASELQAKHNGEQPVLIRVETSAGHGAGKSTAKKIDEAADLLSFMFYNFEEPVIYEY